MRGLLKYLSPFAPDQSGAVEAVYELGGIIVICDAGGCTGNICGFDEPRWLESRSAVFSAGLRDMDAILGRDEKLIEKLKLASEYTNAKFIAIISTPVPAVIATDMRALKRMSEKKTGIPTITIDAKGTGLYDEGEEETYLKIVKAFAKESFEAEKGRVNVIGATPLELSLIKNDNLIKSLKNLGYENICAFGFGSGLEEIKEASKAEKNIVIAPSGIKCAEYLKEKFGTPYEIFAPYIPQKIIEEIKNLKEEKILIVHQQVLANEVRKKILLNNKNAKIDVASFFKMEETLKSENDVKLNDEASFAELVKNGKYEHIFADKNLKRAIKNYSGKFTDLRHFAVSGKLEDEE